jgi:hypothetical protein
MEDLMISNPTNMKLKQNIILKTLCFLLLFPALLSAQEQRTVKTKVADILALLPASDNSQGERLFNELISTGSEGLSQVTDGVKPNGVTEGVPFRYAVSLLTHYAKNNAQKASIETACLDALKKADNTEVKAYFIANVQLVGTNNSIGALLPFLSDKDLFSPAIGTLETIGSKEALQALTDALPQAPPQIQQRIVKGLGRVQYRDALQNISALATSSDKEVQRQALWAIARIGDPSSASLLLGQAKNAAFKASDTEATQALLEYMNEISRKGNTVEALQISQHFVVNTPEASQQHFRLDALKTLAKLQPQETLNVLIQDMKLFGGQYRKEILKIAAAYVADEKVLKRWEKEYKNAAPELAAEILSMLARLDKNPKMADTRLVPALRSKVGPVRMVAASEIAKTKNREYAKVIVDYLLKAQGEEEILSAKTALLQLIDKDNVALLAQALSSADARHKVALLEALKEKRATTQYDAVSQLIRSPDRAVKKAAYESLGNVSSPKNMIDLLSLLTIAQNEDEVKPLQQAIIAAIDEQSSGQVLQAFEGQKIKLLPVLPFINDKTVLQRVESLFENGGEREKEVAFDALANWQNHEAARTLLAIRKNDALSKYHERAFTAFISQVSKSAWTDDQKLLMLRAIMEEASTEKEKVSVIRAAGNVRTFLSLIFVSGYLDDPQMSAFASRAAMQIALPSADAKPGLTGTEVRNILEKMLDKLQGNDSQYERIDIETYLAQLPRTRGFEPIFNGKDLSGWQGLVEDPIKRSKMSKEELAKKQAEANSKIKESWSVKDGAIWFSGEGANLCTIRPYGDFEMIVDWKISRNGDSGIYLRGSPQVQIWDTSRVDAGAQVGSGGLYNNQKNPSKPLVVADNPVGEWNTFNIKMIGERVTVLLNGQLVVDNVVMENYWDRNLPIFPEEAIELQAHGTELAFRNIYVKELNVKPSELSNTERQEGFQLLFNGKDLDNWVGNKTDYVVEDNTIAIYPAKESHGNLSTEKEFGDFIFRFEFQLTPGANNGVGIHAPLEGDVAYAGKEIQVLDNTAAVYAKLEPWQYHGSVYGIIPAKRDFLKPVGEWNEEEIYVKGDYIRVTLNGTVIVEGDLKKASRNGTIDKKDHPGLQRHSGHISFLGHGSVVKFRNIRIRELDGKK